MTAPKRKTKRPTEAGACFRCPETGIFLEIGPDGEERPWEPEPYKLEMPEPEPERPPAPAPAPAPAAAETRAPPADTEPLMPAFAPVPVKPRRDGWTAQRQRQFVEVLAETGCVVTASRETGMSARSAYRLAARPDAAAFAIAWDHALAIAARRLGAIAFEYATHGMVETVTDKDGEVVAERRRPSERVLLYLLAHLDPHRLGRYAFVHSDYHHGPSPHARRRELVRMADMFKDAAPEAGPEASPE